MVESGFITLLGFSTPGVAGHVVTVFGHTRNSDEWHPQALPAYAGPSGNEFYSSSGWIDHFIIHDDNFGPYYSLSARALEVDPRIQAQIIVPLCPIKIVNSSVWAESTASLFLNNLLADIQSAAQPYATGDWWSYITASDRKYILRSILISREDYLRHIGSICGHDLSRMKQTELMLFRGLPELFWMVEFTLPALYTGNRSKLGEVLLSSVARRDPTNLGGLFLGIRMPKVFASLDAMGTAIIAHQVSLDSHASLFRIRDHDNQW